MAKIATYAAVAISIAAAIPTGGTSLLGSAALSAGLTASAATASLIASGVALAANIGAGLLAKKPHAGGGGTQTDWAADPNAKIPIVLGRTGVGGNIVYRKGSGDGDRNKYQTLTTVLSLGPIDSIGTFYCDRKATTFSGSVANGIYFERLWRDTQIGACPEASALNTGVGNKPGWTASHKLSGLAADQVTMLYDADGDNTFTTEPQMLRVPRGVLCYDPREDSTWPGGSGTQRADDQATWAYSNNPFIVGLTFAIGWHQNGNRRGGAGQPIDTIDLGSFVEAANIADLNGWTVGGQISTGDDKWDALKAILQAGGGEPIRDGAMLSCIIQAPRVSIATIGAGDLIAKATVPRSRPRKERLNGIVPKYRSERHFWEQVSGTVARIAVHETEDGGARTREITYPLVQVESGDDASQPTQLAGYDVELSRERMPIVLPLKLRWIGYRTGDCISCAIDELGLGEQQLIIIKRSLDPATGAVTLTVRTEDSAKHARVFALTGDVPPVTVFDRPALPGSWATGDGDLSTVIANSFPVGLTISAADDGTITIGDHTRRYTDGHADVAVAGDVLASGGDAGGFFAIGYDDEDRAGGAVTYQLFTDDLDARVSPSHPYRHYVGYVTIPTAGSPPSDGGGATPPGGACVVADTPIMFAEGERPAATMEPGDIHYTRHEAHLNEPGGGWGHFATEGVEIVDSSDIWEATVGGRYLAGTGPHKVWPGSWTTLGEIGRKLTDDEMRVLRKHLAETLQGGAAWRRWYEEDYLADPDKPAVPVVKATVAWAHTYVSNGVLSHNIKQVGGEVA